MKRLCIDMDETIADAAAEYLGRYNRDHGTSLSKADLTGRTIYDVVHADHRERVTAYFHSDDFFVDLPVIPDSQRVIAALMEKYEVFIASAAMEFPSSFLPKFRWLERHFPFIDPMKIVFCGDKSILHADYLIDDHPHHFKNFQGEGILFSAPHNHGVIGYRRVEDWRDVEGLLLGEQRMD
jgi:5'(3')-deoxyribonucleotidase